MTALTNFFSKYKCPDPTYANEYIAAADRYGIDYRLLPAISIQESTCGKHEALNNWWGWDSARTGFSSVPGGIDFVARQLADSPYYKGKTLIQILSTYNKHPAYAPSVLQLIGEIKP